jgi:hypothetical protein
VWGVRAACGVRRNHENMLDEVESRPKCKAE